MDPSQPVSSLSERSWILKSWTELHQCLCCNLSRSFCRVSCDTLSLIYCRRQKPTLAIEPQYRFVHPLVVKLFAVEENTTSSLYILRTAVLPEMEGKTLEEVRGRRQAREQLEERVAERPSTRAQLAINDDFEEQDVS